jgi:hypothetical protein
MEGGFYYYIQVFVYALADYLISSENASVVLE